MISKLKDWFDLTRAYALPTSIFSWLVAFSFASINGGNSTYGFIALLGICLAHLGANVFDDYIDFKYNKNIVEANITDDNDYLVGYRQKRKCELILNGSVSPKEVLIISFVLFALALIMGLLLTFKIGYPVLIFMILSGIIGLSYPILGKYRLCELAIILVYGPLLFGGVYYVMTGHYDFKTLIVCIPSMLMTLNLLYTDTMLDYNSDKYFGKKTIANLAPDMWTALKYHKVLLIVAFLSVILPYVAGIVGWEAFLTLSLVPMAMSLIDSMRIFVIDNDEIADAVNVSDIMGCDEDSVLDGESSFIHRMCLARNLMICFSLIFAIAILLTVAV